MAENSNIEWTTHTFNPWIGCTKLTAACDYCYAEVWDKRFGGGLRWGPRAARTRTKSWSAPIRWNAGAVASGKRERVFCASLADVFDNHPSIAPEWRRDLWALIRQTPALDWLLLTKRPQNIRRFLPDDWSDGYPNVWLGATVEDQVEHDRRVPHLTAVPAVVRFLSMEPLQGMVDLRGAEGLNWIITGGESGPYYRPADPDWFRYLRDQCANANVAFLFKQWEGRNRNEIRAQGRELDGFVHNGYPIARL